jgi:hypothetical protein
MKGVIIVIHRGLDRVIRGVLLMLVFRLGEGHKMK